MNILSATRNLLDWPFNYILMATSWFLKFCITKICFASFLSFRRVHRRWPENYTWVFPPPTKWISANWILFLQCLKQFWRLVLLKCLKSDQLISGLFRCKAQWKLTLRNNWIISYRQHEFSHDSTKSISIVCWIWTNKQTTTESISTGLSMDKQQSEIEITI